MPQDKWSIDMQYWVQKLGGKMERVEESQFKKHPEIKEFLINKGFTRVMSETDHTEYKKPLKKQSMAKKVKQVAKKVTKKKK
tara:strand:- start:195 stop:440 length:246 start_codon:yes stop_codon:yes gene_type:complete